MESGSNIGLDLYVKKVASSDRQQYMDSELILALIKGQKIEGDIRVVPLKDLNRDKGFFDCINEPGEKSELPFLVLTCNDETGIILGFSGLEKITDMLDNLYRCGVTVYDTMSGNISSYYQNQQH